MDEGALSETAAQLDQLGQILSKIKVSEEDSVSTPVPVIDETVLASLLADESVTAVLFPTVDTKKSLEVFINF